MASKRDKELSNLGAGRCGHETGNIAMCWIGKSIVYWIGKNAVWLFLLTTCGCGSGNLLPLAPVHGTVTYHGRPLDHGEVVLHPEEARGGVQALAAITENGSFEMHTGSRNGAPLGKYIVTVHCRKKLPEEKVRQPIVPPSLIPEKYSNDLKSPLRFEVKGEENDLGIVLD